MAEKKKTAKESFFQSKYGYELQCLKSDKVSRENTVSGVILRSECRGCAGPSDLAAPGCRFGIVKNLTEMFSLNGVRLHGLMESEYTDSAISVLEKLVQMSAEADRLGEMAKSHVCPKGMVCPVGGEPELKRLKDILLDEPEKFYYYLQTLETRLRGGQTQADPCRSATTDGLASLSAMHRKFEELVLVVWDKAFAITNINTMAPDWLGRKPVLDDPSRLPRGIGIVLNRYRLTRPAFSMAWVNQSVPHTAQEPPLHEYNIGSARIRLYRLTNRPEGLYHMVPVEYDLSQFPLKYIRILEELKLELTELTPPDFDLTKPELARDYARKFAKERIRSTARKVGFPLDEEPGYQRIEEMLAESLTKYTAGLGVSEIFLRDTNLTDLYIDSPVESNELYVVLGGKFAGRYITNVRITDSDSKGMLSRFRYESGRPFSEASPVLECDINEFETRATVIGAPFSPKGLAFALRKHSKDPWTLLRLINLRSLTPLAAGLISFLIHGQSTIMVAGSRGAGKSSLLGAMMLEFPPHQRILTIEDTMELPVWEMQAMGYHIQPMLVQSALGGYGEKTADDALRVALRLGESAIVLGEVRGQKETSTLYEAMRAGTAGSSVMGTIHGNSPKAVYERVVADMKISETSFSATDIIVVAGVRRPAGASYSLRRVDCISEVVVGEDKHVGFHDLMLYDPRVDALLPTEWFFNSTRIKRIAEMWSLTPTQAIQQVWARASLRHIISEYAAEANKSQVLQAKNVLKYNNKFQELIDRYGVSLDCKQAVSEWNEWFREMAQFV